MLICAAHSLFRRMACLVLVIAVGSSPAIGQAPPAKPPAKPASDPSTSDVQAAIRKAVDFLYSKQQPNGGWESAPEPWNVKNAEGKVSVPHGPNG